MRLPSILAVFFLAACAVVTTGVVVQGCATTAQTQTVSQTITASLQYAQATAATANRLVVVALDSGAIGVDRAKAIGASADTVVETIRYARTLLAKGDAAGTQNQLLAIAADLALLADFIAHQKQE